MVVLEKKSTKSAMKTMGPAKGEVPSPEKYLKKHSKEPKMPDSEFMFTVCVSLGVNIVFFMPMFVFQRRTVPKRFITPALRGNQPFLRGQTNHRWAFIPKETFNR